MLQGKETLRENERLAAGLALRDVVPPVLGFGLIDTLPCETGSTALRPLPVVETDSLGNAHEPEGAVRG